MVAAGVITGPRTHARKMSTGQGVGQIPAPDDPWVGIKPDSDEKARGRLEARANALGHRSVRGRCPDHDRPLEGDATT